MKIDCVCGDWISDAGEGVPYRAHIIADLGWIPFWDAVDAAAEGPPASDATLMGLRNAGKSRRVWECRTCGRLWIFAKDGQVLSYSPDNGKPNAVLS